MTTVAPSGVLLHETVAKRKNFVLFETEKFVEARKVSRARKHPGLS